MAWIPSTCGTMRSVCMRNPEEARQQHTALLHSGAGAHLKQVFRRRIGCLPSSSSSEFLGGGISPCTPAHRSSSGVLLRGRYVEYCTRPCTVAHPAPVAYTNTCRANTPCQYHFVVTA